MQQIFNAPVNKVINQNFRKFDDSIRTESKTSSVTVKLTETQKEILKDICFDNGIDVSAFVNQAVSVYIKVFPYREKVRRYSDLLIQLLSNLT